MKKYIRITAAALALMLAVSGCGDNKSNNEEKEPAVQEDSRQDMLADRLDELGADITSLKQRAEECYDKGLIDEDKYNEIMQLDDMLADIGSDGTDENILKYNQLKNLIDELKYDLSAAEDPHKTDEDTALTSLMECIEQSEESIVGAHDRGVLPDDRFELFNQYKAEVKGYIDGTAERGDALLDRLAEIRSDITTMASQSEADNETIDKLLEEPVTVEDNTELEELVSNYLELQSEVQDKVDGGELPEDKLVELLNIGIDVVKVKEALQTGDITDETRQTMRDSSAKLKTYAEGIGSDKAQYFE